MKQVAIALLIEVPDDVDPLKVEVTRLDINVREGWGYRYAPPEDDTGLAFVKVEVHPDPDAVFRPDDEVSGDYCEACGACGDDPHREGCPWYEA